MISKKLDISGILKSQINVYSNEKGQILFKDVFWFLMVPALLGTICYFLNLSQHHELDFIYQCVAFLSGFIFSVFILILNLLERVSQNPNGRNHKKSKETISEVGTISLFCFLLGILILLIGFLEVVLRSFDTDLGFIDAGKVLHSLVIAMFLSLVLNLIMLTKRLNIFLQFLLK